MNHFSEKSGIPIIVDIDRDLEIKIQDSIKSGSLKSVTVKMEATHSGKVNGNYWYYSPYGMSNGAKSFIRPYAKRVTRDHLDDSETLGRVIEANYISYSDAPEKLLNPVNKNSIREIKDFIKSPNYRKSDYKGLGHVELIAKITDPDAINKILDNKYVSVSVGGNAKSAICSVCGENVKNGHRHMRGAQYNGEPCFYIGGDMVFEHVSYVDVPADKKTVSTLIRDAEEHRSYLSILDFETSTQGNTTMVKLDDLDKSNTILVDHAKELGIKDFVCPTDIKDKSNYVFIEEQSFPISDALSASLVKDFFVTKIEDSEDKQSILQLVDEKLAELGVSDYASVIEGAKATKDPENVVKDSLETGALADLVVAKIQDSLGIKASSYQSARTKALAKENQILSNKVAELESQLRDSLVSQISTLDKIEDSDKIERLKERSIDSLMDKLQDIKDYQSKEVKEDKEDKDVKNEEGTEVKDSQDKNTLPKDGITITDSVDGEGQTDTGKEGEPQNQIKDSESLVFKDKKELEEAYRKVLKEKGLTKALQFKRSAKIAA